MSGKALCADGSYAGWQIGKAYMIQTVTAIVIGQLVHVDEHELWLAEGAWVPDFGRLTSSLKDPVNIAETEPFPDPVAIGRGAIVYATVWKHGPLREQK